METKHIQGKVVAVCGKGGVGKTAFTTMLTKVLKDDPDTGRLLVVDADRSYSREGIGSSRERDCRRKN